jgi:putative oligomerization/nucleic acid binding protein
MLRRRPVMRAAVGTAVVAGTATAVSGRVARRQEEKAAAAAPPPAAAAPPPETAAADTSGPDLEQLKELAALKDQGILTEEEFAAQKAKILGG